MGYIGIFIAVAGLVLLIKSTWSSIKWFFGGVICLIISVFISTIYKSEPVYSYKSSEYKMETTYEIKQNGNQVICDTIYEFKRK